MEQEDYLKRQIDQLARVLGKALTNLLGLKNKGQASFGIEISNQILKEELDFDIQELIDINTEDFIQTLRTEKHFTNENLDRLAEIFFVLADGQAEKDNRGLYEKCLTIYEYLENADKTYSFDRQMKINHIKNLL